MTEKELKRYEEARKLEVGIQNLRQAAMVVSNPEIAKEMSVNQLQRIFWTALELTSDQLADLFLSKSRELESKILKL